MRKSFEAGDKIRFVGAVELVNLFCAVDPWKAEVIEPAISGLLNKVKIRFFRISEGWTTGYIHPRQVTHRLRKKAKPEGRMITREQLAKAWDDQVREDVIDYGSTTFAFREFCEALGFPPTAKKEGV